MTLKEFNKMTETAPDNTELYFYLIPNDGTELDDDKNDLLLENLDIIYSSGVDADTPSLDLGLQFPVKPKEPKETQSVYFILFGEDACKILENSGIEDLKQEIEDGLCFNYLKYEEGITTPIELLTDFQNWNVYSLITEEEFKQIKEF